MNSNNHSRNGPTRRCRAERRGRDCGPDSTAARIFIRLMVLVVVLGFASQRAVGQKTTSAEHKVKVAYLYNFLRYVRWPQQAFSDDASPMVIGILNGDPHARLLDQVAAKKRVRGRTIVVRRFGSVKEIKQCHLVFLYSGISAADEAEAIALTEQQQALLICDSGLAPQPGAPIRFFSDQDGTIGLQINIDAMERRNLQADAKLLNIASVVRD